MPFATTTKMPWNAFHFGLVALLNSTIVETVNESLPHLHGAFEMLAKNIIFPFHCWVYDFQWRGMFCIFNYNFQFSLTFARLKHTDKNRHIHTNIQQLYAECWVQVELQEMNKYFAMCGIFNAKQNYIYSEGMQREDVLLSPLPSPLLLPLPLLLLPSSDVWKSSAPDKFYAKIKCKNEKNAHNSYKYQIQVVKYRLQMLFPWWIQNNWKEKFTRDCSLPNDLAWIFMFVLS